MIATWVGGPKDGTVEKLQDSGPIIIPVSDRQDFFSDATSPTEEMAIKTRTIWPVKTERGWILPYKEGAD